VPNATGPTSAVGFPMINPSFFWGKKRYYRSTRFVYPPAHHIWLVALTILKNISQWEGLSQILWEIKNV